MTVVILFSIVVYFVTSSDSGSLVIDIMAANGMQEPPTFQRVFWAVSEGAAASVLLGMGGEAALKALRSVSLVRAQHVHRVPVTLNDLKWFTSMLIKNLKILDAIPTYCLQRDLRLRYLSDDCVTTLELPH